jgi:outer membrane receptor protein involved in Fe transport
MARAVPLGNGTDQQADKTAPWFIALSLIFRAAFKVQSHAAASDGASVANWGRCRNAGAKRMLKKFTSLFATVAGAALALNATSGAAHAQTPEAPTPTERTEPATAEEIVVTGQIVYRNRTAATAPVLEYGADYFQRFEPLTAGDALKRVPSVAFLSDVNESDGVRLRGLDPAYTQILINGEQIPGSGSGSGAFGNGVEGSFFVDRIPAELIERVEVVRSASANRSGDAVAGAINIVLRDAYALDGGFVRAGALSWDDGKLGETLGGVWGGKIGQARLLLGANMQDRHNPKNKFSARYNRPGAGNVLNNVEYQTDVRDGTDYSANFSLTTPLLIGELQLDGFWVRTARDEDEDSIEYRNAVVPATQNLAAFVGRENLLTINDNNVDIDQQTLAFNAKYTVKTGAGETRLKLGYASFINKEFEYEDETEFLRDAIAFPEVDRYTRDVAQLNLDDEEFKAKLEHKLELGGLDLEFGVHYERKGRDNLIEERPRQRTGSGGIPSIPNGTQSTTAVSPIPLPAPAAFVAVPGGNNKIVRTRIDPYVQADGETGAFEWELGLRYETTDNDIQDFTVAGSEPGNSYNVLLPSAHLRWNLTDDDRFSASIARTVRRPSFSFLSPALLANELGDNDFRGNPQLEPELAWGLDVGYERRLGRGGVAGINVFYRDITDVIETFATSALDADGLAIYSARNTGDGQVYGVELDLSTPLTFAGLENTGVFVNASWLDSDINDEFGSRTFNDQSTYVVNAGFIQDLPSLAAAFGVTYRQQGEAYSRVVGEEITTTYGGDLEAFVEKRFGKRFVVRLTGSNLLDYDKEETFNKFDSATLQRSRTFDEFELEREDVGPTFQLIGRLAF